jgi:hypothetical protein
VVDPFRAPTHPYGPGNRGIDYATEAGAPVRASARGVVAFAGAVGATLHVTVLHPDGVRTTYSFLRSVAVRRGERVQPGHVLGTSGGTLHFGARVGEEYIDPRSLFAGRRVRARLVPDDAVRPASLAVEQGFVRELLRHLGRAAGTAVEKTATLAVAAARAELADLARGHRELAEWLAHLGELSPAAWMQVAAELAARPDDARPPNGRHP